MGGIRSLHEAQETISINLGVSSQCGSCGSGGRAGQQSTSQCILRQDT